MRLQKTFLIGAALTASLGASACGRTDLGRSPSQVVIDSMEAASGAQPDEFVGNLTSDVVTLVDVTINGQEQTVSTVYNDLGRVTMRILLRDAGSTTSPTVPTGLNAVTFSRYRVEYRRTDGRNQQGVDVPYSFDSAFTATVPPTGTVTVPFELVRNVAKKEAPLAALANNPTIISMIAEVTFYGQDLAGNDVVVKGAIGASFGNFADPE